jgi:hypothetical protein
MQTIDKQDVDPWDLEQRPWEGTTLGQFLRNQGVQAAQLVMLGGVGAGTSRGFWSRVVMAESNGWWIMELIHSLTAFGDLYPFGNDTDPPERNIGRFDEMSGQSQTHPTAFTKNELGWLPEQNMGLYHSGATDPVGYILQFVSYADPHVEPFHGESFVGVGTRGLRIGDDFPYVIVEARKKTDQFETGMPLPYEMGIPGEGVIAYRVQTRKPLVGVEREGGKTPLYLMTQTPLQVGQSAVLDGVRLKVTGETPKAFIVLINETPSGGGTGGAVVLPDFNDWTFQEATHWLNQRGVNWDREPHFSTENVDHSKPGPGSTVTPGADTVTLYLKPHDDGHQPL